MAYCKSCGAYIPDGTTVCLACGYDEAAAQSGAGQTQAAAAARSAQQEDMKEILERHRRLQQEKNRQWAESEKERRDKQTENARWAQEEFARRQAEREVEAERLRREDEARRREGQSSRLHYEGTGATHRENKILAALSYLSFLFVAPFVFSPEDEFARYHAKQGLRLFIFSAISDVLTGIVPFAGILTLLRFFFIYKGITNAMNGKKEPLPYIGTIGEK